MLQKKKVGVGRVMQSPIRVSHQFAVPTLSYSQRCVQLPLSPLLYGGNNL